MTSLIIKKYDDIYNRHIESLSSFNKMIPENKKFIREGDIVKYIRFDDKDEIIILHKLENFLHTKKIFMYDHNGDCIMRSL